MGRVAAELPNALLYAMWRGQTGEHREWTAPALPEARVATGG